MEAKNANAEIYYQNKHIDCTERALTENHLNHFSKETLIQFIMKHREKLIVEAKKHKKDYGKKPKKELDFDS